MEEQERSVTLGEMFRVIFSKKWLALIIAVLITVASALVILFAYNPIKTEYRSTFSINFAGSSDGKYPNNHAFDYREIISRSALVAVKNSDASFGNIDLKKLNSNISISRNYEELSSGLTGVDYTITVKASIFKNIDQATDFITALAKYPENYVNNWANSLNHGAYLSKCDESGDDYASKINFLKLQIEYLTESYNNLSLSTDLNVNTSDVKTALVNLQLITNDLRICDGELLTEKYIKSLDVLESYALEYVSLKEELSFKKGVWDLMYPDTNINDYLDPDSWANKRMLAEEIRQIEQRMESIIGYFEKYKGSKVRRDDDGYAILEVPDTKFEESEASREFGEKLEKIKTQLQEETVKYAKTFAALQDEAAFITYNGAPLLDYGGINTAIAIILSLAVGIIIACAVALIVGMPPYLKNRDSDNSKVENAQQANGEDKS